MCAVSQALSPGPEHPAGGGSRDSGCAEQHVAARDGPSKPMPQPLEPPAAEACGSELGAGSPPGQAEGPHLFSAGLSVQDFLPTGQGAEQPADTEEASVLEEALQTIGSDLPASAASAVTDTGCPAPQEYDFRTVLRPAVVASASPGSLQTTGGSLGCEELQLWRNTDVQLDTCVTDGQGGSAFSTSAQGQPPPGGEQPSHGAAPWTGARGWYSDRGFCFWNSPLPATVECPRPRV